MHYVSQQSKKVEKVTIKKDFERVFQQIRTWNDWLLQS